MCNEYETLITKALDHELSKEEENQLVAHLEMCDECREEYEALKQMKCWLSEVEEEELPEGFHEELMQQIKTPKKKRPLWQFGGAAAACLLMASALFYQINELGLGSKHTEMAESAPYEVSEAALDQSQDTMTGAESAVPKSRASEAEETEEAAGAAIDENSSCVLADGQSENNSESEEWLIQVTDPENFKDKVADYLEVEGIVYEKTDEGFKIEDFSEPESFETWLTEQGAKISKEQLQQDDTSLILVIHSLS